MSALIVIFAILVFPGFLFQFFFSSALEWVDRKLYARMQNRMGPLYTGPKGFLQPIADIAKLFAKEDLTPAAAEAPMFNLMPLVALASVCAAGMLLPFWALGHNSFPGDLLVMAYLLAIPSFTMFLAGWFSVSPFALIGASRVLTQLFAYEVPFFLALLTPSLISGSWQLSEIQAFQWWHGSWWDIVLRIIAQTLALLVALTCLQAKLERVPFDAPEAETEVVAGCLTEYSGKKLGIFRLQKSILMYVGAGLLATVFMPSFPALGPVFGGLWLLFKIVLVVALLSGIRASFARIRIDQIVVFSWKYLAPLSLVQFFIVLVLRANQVVLP